jgi:hypothetical protein
VTTAEPRTAESRQARFLAVPIDVYLAMQMHNDAVGRDLMFAIEEGSVPDVAKRLAGLVSPVYERLVDVRDLMRSQVEEARAAGRTHVDLAAWYVTEDVAASLAYYELVQEADTLAERGVILVPSPGPEVEHFRDWMMEELREQVLNGRAPRAYEPPG